MASIKRCTSISPVTFVDLDLAAAGVPGPGVAPGGTTDQLLAKNSATNYDTKWVNPAAALDALWVGTSAPSNPAIELWYDTDEPTVPYRQGVTTLSTGTTSYTIGLADEGFLLEFTAGSGIALSVPTNATTAFVVGTRIDFFQSGAGKITVAAVTPGTTTIVAAPSTILRAVGSAASLIKTATDKWLLTGDLT